MAAAWSLKKQGARKERQCLLQHRNRAAYAIYSAPPVKRSPPPRSAHAHAGAAPPAHRVVSLSTLGSISSRPGTQQSGEGGGGRPTGQPSAAPPAAAAAPPPAADARPADPPSAPHLASWASPAAAGAIRRMRGWGWTSSAPSTGWARSCRGRRTRQIPASSPAPSAWRSSLSPLTRRGRR